MAIDFVAIMPLKENLFWPSIKTVLEKYYIEEVEESLKYKRGSELRKYCYLWKSVIYDLENSNFITASRVNHYYSETRTPDWIRMHVWIEIMIKDDPYWYVLDRTIGQFADKKVIKSVGGLEGLKSEGILNENFINKFQIATDEELLRKFEEYDSNRGFYGLKEDYPFNSTSSSLLVKLAQSQKHKVQSKPAASPLIHPIDNSILKEINMLKRSYNTKIFGITGCVGSGKTTLAEFLSRMGCYIIKVDEIVSFQKDRRIVRIKSIISRNRKLLQIYVHIVRIYSGRVIRKKVLKDIKSVLLVGDKKNIFIDFLYLKELYIREILDGVWCIFRDEEKKKNRLFAKGYFRRHIYGRSSQKLRSNIGYKQAQS